MTPSPRSAEPAELLAQTEWLGRLATALVPAADRDDLVQDVLLTALQSEQRPRSLRAWLATVARNRAARRRLRDAARRERELASVNAVDAEPATVEVVAGFALHRSVVEAVAQLREPYRGTLLLRYWEDLQPAEIAQRLQVPVDTVRTRLKRAVAELRATLDRQHGRRSAWLVPLLGLPAVQKALPPVGAVSVATATTLLQGVMMTKQVWLAAAAVILVAGGAAFFALERAVDETSPRRDQVATVPAASSTMADEVAVLPVEAHDREAAASLVEIGALQVTVQRDAEHPSAGVAVHLLRAGRAGQPLAATTDARGEVMFGELAAGDYLAMLATGPRAEVRVEAGDVARCTLQVDDGLRVVGRVVTLDRLPCAGARVHAQLEDRPEVELLLATTDEHGAFALDGVASGTMLVARAAGWQPSLPTHGEVRGVSGQTMELELRLGARGNRLTGVVQRPDGSSAPRAMVVIGVDEDSHKHLEGVRELRTRDGNGKLDRESFLVRADDDGVFATDEVPWGSCVVLARGVGDDAALVGGTATTVQRGADNFVTVRIDAGAKVFGMIRDELGQPYAGLSLMLDYEASVAFGEFDRDRASPVVTDRVGVVAADGSFSIAGLLPAEYQLVAVFPGQRQRLERVELRVGEHRRLDLVVPRTWSLQVRVQDVDGAPLAGHAVWLSRDGTIKFRDAIQCLSDAHGRFTATGLKDDDYVLSVHAPVRGEEWPVQRMPSFVQRVARGQREVVAVVSAATPTLRGRVLAETELPAAGAQVRLSLLGFGGVLRAETDADGRFDYQQLPPGEYALEAQYRGPVLARRVLTEAGVACDLGDLMLPPIAPLHVLLQTGEGLPVSADLQLLEHVTDERTGAAEWRRLTTARADRGDWRCERVTAGLHRLLVEPRGLAPSVHDLDLHAGVLRELRVTCSPGVEQRLEVVVLDLARLEPGRGYATIEVDDVAGRLLVKRYTERELAAGNTLPVELRLLPGSYRVRLHDNVGHVAADIVIGETAGPAVRLVMQVR
ncbi:MAG: sigma-70 family RNA polymerase sigma factor [Planctomycetes bacterium]|nr:sigma-70 family RNA polymerase sigma factor [Planctomycetota bacterium]